MLTLGIAAVSPASLPLKDESLDLLFARDDKKKIVKRRFFLTGSGLALSGETDIRRVTGNQEDSSCESFLSFESSVEIEEIRALVDTEDYEGPLVERVRTDCKEDNHVTFSSDSSSITGNQLQRQNACEPGQLTGGSREPHAATSSDRNLESQGARPKHTQIQPPVNTPLWPSSRPVSNGLAKDFLSRHSQDRATHGNLYTDDRDLPSLVPELLRDNSSVDGLTSASEGYNVSPYFGDNMDGRPSQPGTRQETKDEDHYTEVLPWMPESNVSENSLNFDFTVGVLRQKDEHVEADVPCTIANESSPVQVVANYHASDQNLSEQIHPPVTQGIERRTVGNRRFHSVTPRREEEPAASQRCCSFERQEEMMELKEQLMESEAEIQQLRAELGRYLFLEDKGKRSGKLQLLLSRAPTSDERRQYAANSSFNKTSVDRTLLVEGASLKRQPGMHTVTVYFIVRVDVAFK